MITYGHENFIEEAVASVLMQETDFEIELILSNDNSPDNTDAIVRKIIREHPKGSLIKYTRQEKNRGMMPNFIWALGECTGRYIAICEGDDYWSDPFKLKKQFDLLEDGADYSMVFSNFYFKEEDTGYIKESDIKCQDVIDTNYLIQIFNIRTCTVFLRNSKELLAGLPENLPYGDYPLFLRASLLGKIKFDKDYTAFYRINEGSVSHSVEFKIPEINRLKILKWFANENPKYKSAVGYSLAFLIQKLLNRKRLNNSIDISVTEQFLRFFSLYLKTFFFRNKCVKLNPFSIIRSSWVVLINRF
jgi:glycosyltransferase involved in cell wall biosynthesis